MKFNDEITLDIAKAVSDVMEGKAKKEEVKYPHKMYHPETGEEVEVKDKAGHDKYNKLGYTHTPKEVAQPKAKGEKEFKSMHDVEVSGEAPDGKVKKAKKGNYYKEETISEASPSAWTKLSDQQRDQLRVQYQKLEKENEKLYDMWDHEYNDADGDEDKADRIRAKMDDNEEKQQAMVDKYGRGIYKKPGFRQKNEESTPEGPAKEESEKQKKYQAFFNKALKKFGVKSPAELDDEKKKEFFDYVDANYEADNETDEDVTEVLGTIKKVAKKAVDKIKGKKEKPKSGNPVDMKKLLNQPGYIKAQIKALEKKLAATSAKFKKAQDDGDEEREDYWGGIEVSQATELDKLKDKYKKAMKEK